MEDTIAISYLNDFIFCPASIYFHLQDNKTDILLYQDSYQINGTSAHDKVDKAQYSDKKEILQGIPIYCERYNLSGKIDVFDIEKGTLTERKRTIKTIYDGYIFQLYAQYFALVEIGYKVNEIRFYSVTDNKVYKIKKPEENIEMLEKFQKTIEEINKFDLNSFKQTNTLKCEHCIYEPMCSFSKGD